MSRSRWREALPGTGDVIFSAADLALLEQTPLSPIRTVIFMCAHSRFTSSSYLGLHERAPKRLMNDSRTTFD